MISKVFSLAIDDFCILKLSLVINMLFFSNRTLPLSLSYMLYMIGVFDLWRFEQRTNGNRHGARIRIFENGVTPIY